MANGDRRGHKNDYEIELIRAQIANLNAETAKNLWEMRFPLVVLAAPVLAAVAVILSANGGP